MLGSWTGGSHASSHHDPGSRRCAVLGAACAETGAYYTNGTTEVYASTYTPELVTVSPGVPVIVGWNEPVFYSNNY